MACSSPGSVGWPMPNRKVSAWKAASISPTTRPTPWRLPPFACTAIALKTATWFFNVSSTADLPNPQWRVLDQAHNKRNLAEYEGYLEVDESLVTAMIRVVRVVESSVESRLKG